MWQPSPNNDDLKKCLSNFDNPNPGLNVSLKKLNKILHSSNFFLLITKDLSVSTVTSSRCENMLEIFSHGLLINLMSFAAFKNFKYFIEIKFPIQSKRLVVDVPYLSLSEV